MSLRPDPLSAKSPRRSLPVYAGGTTHADPPKQKHYRGKPQTSEEQSQTEKLGRDLRELDQFRQRQMAQGLRKTVLGEAFQVWGQKNREDKLVEEAGEAMQAIMKARYNPCDDTRLHYIEEIVDLGLLVDQIKLIFETYGWGEDLARLEQAKLAKLQRKLQEGNRS